MLLVLRFAIYFSLFLLYSASAHLLSEKVRKEKNSYEDYDIEEDLIVPENARDWKKPVSSLSRTTIDRLRKKLPPKYEDDRNLCYCNYSPDGCGGYENETCMKFTEAACFYFAKKVYDDEVGDYIIEEKYGCAPLSLGSGGSYFTCYAHLVAHHEPMGIQCCYEGSYCNVNLTLPHFLTKRRYTNSVASIVPWALAIVTLCVVAIVAVFFFNKQLAKKLKVPLKSATSLASDIYAEKSPMMIDVSSGSGSGVASLNEKTVAHCLEMIAVIGYGRYGEVRKAWYKGDRLVAVKSFCTKDEESWKNEKEIYQTMMLNHENILQYVAADISSEDSITRLLLVTDFHEFGPLHEYLQRDGPVSVLEALQLAESAASGLEHLHSKVRGTGTLVKPAIAHRDIKSKNVLVKRRGVCCIADFGLAVSEDTVNADKPINIQVGTKRYMAPEVLNKTLNPKCFFDFKMADIYSFSLVIWEILRTSPRWECKMTCSDSLGDSGYGSSGSGNKANITQSCLVSSRLRSASNFIPEHANENSRRKPIQPYDDVFPSDPSLEDMRRLVCEEKRRPLFDASLKNDQALADVCFKIEECWAENINTRPTMMGVKRELTNAIMRCKKAMSASDLGGSDYGTMSLSSYS